MSDASESLSSWLLYMVLVLFDLVCVCVRVGLIKSDIEEKKILFGEYGNRWCHRVT
jgi:hypothetical protein